MSAVKPLEQFEFHHTLENSKGLSIVFFSSAECLSCRYWEQLLDQYSDSHGSINIFKVDAGQDQALIEEFDVFHLPALYLYSDGEYHCQLQCEANINELDKAIQAALKQPAEEMP